MATPVTGLRMGGAFDLLDVHNTGGETWTLAGYASFQATEKLSFHARGEYLRDRGDQKKFDFPGFFAPDKTLGVTATAQYDLWQNVISRLELRWDHSLTGDAAFGDERLASQERLDARWQYYLQVLTVSKNHSTPSGLFGRGFYFAGLEMPYPRSGRRGCLSAEHSAAVRQRWPGNATRGHLCPVLR